MAASRSRSSRVYGSSDRLAPRASMASCGAGATAIQIIPEIAGKVAELTVFQRRPNWSAPLNNSPISNAEMADIRARYDEIFAACLLTPGAFIHGPDKRGFYEVSREERIKFWDKLYDEPGFGIWLGNFREIFMDEAANAEFSEYIADRIRRRVKDPKIAEKLIPRDHGFGVQRLPLETKYFEAYNRDNVHLVDISETPLVRFTEKGLRTTARDYEFDIIVYATGFDAITGAYDLIDIRGIGGERLADKWKHAPSTFLGMLVHGFPNMLMPTGPQSASASTNFPRGIENGVGWNSKGRRQLNRQFHIYKHVGPQGEFGIGHLKTHFQGPRARIELRQGIAHAGRKRIAPAGKRHLCAQPRPQVLRVVLGHIRHDPHPVQIGDAIPFRASLELLTA